jgi:hypothetical protein
MKMDQPAMQFGAGQLIFLLIWIVVIIVPFWKIFSKAGFSGWLSLLMLLPLVNLIMLYFLAFARWPATGK